MGLFDVITGRRRPAAPAPDRLFAMSTAFVTLQAASGLSSSGRAAIVFQPLATAEFAAIVADMEEVVRAVGADSGTGVQRADDAYGFRWLVLSGQDFEGLVAGCAAISGALEAGGHGDRVLCAVFAFSDAAGARIYWIYNYKRGAFYPFAPAPGSEQRDTERELVLKAQVGRELPVEADLGRWFPLWGIPI